MINVNTSALATTPPEEPPSNHHRKEKEKHNPDEAVWKERENHDPVWSHVSQKDDQRVPACLSLSFPTCLSKS